MMQSPPAPSDTVFCRSRMTNGLRLITAPMPLARSVAISVYVGAGSRYERSEEAGISHFVEHLCFKGTAKRPTAQLISEAIDGVGGILNAATDREYTVFYAKVARPHLELALDVLCDLVQAPLFDAAELEKERKVVLEELASVADSPGQQVDLLLDELLWPGQPLGWDIAGTKESIEGLTREMVVDYVRRQYVPNNMVVAVAGAVDEAELAGLLAPTLASMASGTPAAWFPAQDGQEEPRCSLRFKRTEQTHIALGLRGLPLEHPDRYALDLLSVLFGESMSSRLLGELRRLAEGVPEDELRKAKELAKGRMLLRMEDTRAVSGWLGGQEMLTGEVQTPEDVVARLEAVTPPDLARVVDGFLRRDALKLAVVGPHRSERRFLPLLEL